MCESLMLVRRAGTLVKGSGDAVILAEQENRAQWGSRGVRLQMDVPAVQIRLRKSAFKKKYSLRRCLVPWETAGIF